MARQHGTIWPLDPHTQAKHAILRRYLQAWLPIMTSWNGRVLYIDGFAGPGRYSGGEDGSPIIALRAALDHPYPITAELVYLFIEADPKRKANLEAEIASHSLPSNITATVRAGKFDETMGEMLDELDDAGKRLAPTFAFVDPFGWSQTPFSVIQRLLANPRSEVLINFMYEEINRFIGVAEHAEKWDRLFGTTDWREILAVSGAGARRRHIRDLYEHQLVLRHADSDGVLLRVKPRQHHLGEVLGPGAGARFVRSFEMRNRGNACDYFLFFATNHAKGLVKMKEAMWKVDPSGYFQFSDATDLGQPVLFEPEPDTAELRRQIERQFAGQTVAIEDIERFVVEETAFLPTHYKSRVRAEMEKQHPPALDVVSARTARRRGQFPSGTRVRFR